MSDLPIIADPSHGVGRADIVIPMSKAAVACGADGLIVEVHPNPKKAMSDGQQTLDYESFRILMDEVAELDAFMRGELGNNSRMRLKAL
jgi:3-deoxy-7-phosphoheptulonate synthase